MGKQHIIQYQADHFPEVRKMIKNKEFFHFRDLTKMARTNMGDHFPEVRKMITLGM